MCIWNNISSAFAFAFKLNLYAFKGYDQSNKLQRLIFSFEITITKFNLDSTSMEIIYDYY